ncbi:MAG: VOC family protein [Pseudomonadota bacterium]
MLKTITQRLMTFIALLACVALGACSKAPAKEAQAPEPSAVPYQIPKIKRPNLVVASIDRSLTIYRDILGFEASTIRTGSENDFSYPVFNIPTDQPLRFISFHEPDERAVLNLTEIKGMDLPRPHSAPYMSTVVIGITDLEAKFEKLKALGLQTTRTEIAGSDTFRFIEQAFVDFDGHLIVCYEILRR